MRINVGIRRRLAPLLENDRRRIELLNGLLMSMPGTPVIYYGDEIGMGDNLFLKDRDGVRTPMQWSPDRNGGFSTAEPVRLYAPVVTDPTYGYSAVSVEAQARNPSSLLTWMQRIVAVRKATKVFGRGTLTLLYPANRRTLAYLREYEDETVLVVANLARTAQAVQLDLSHFAGRTPFEMLGSTAFPPIATAPYTITLGPYGFFWFALVRDPSGTAAPVRSTALPELPTIVVPRGGLALDRWARAAIDTDLVPRALGASEHGRVRDAFSAPELDPTLALHGDRRRPAAHLAAAALRVGRAGPRGCRRPRAQRPARRLDRRCRHVRDDGAADRARDARRRRSCATKGRSHSRWESAPVARRGRVAALGVGIGRAALDPRRRAAADAAPADAARAEQRGRDHAPPARARFRASARAASARRSSPTRGGVSWVAATSQRYIPHPTDAEASLREILRGGTADERLIRSAHNVADALAALHRALGAPGSDPAFDTRPISRDDVAAWRAAARVDLGALVDAGVEGVVAARERVERALDALPDRIDAASARAHGRLTLRRVLLVDGVPIVRRIRRSARRPLVAAQRRRLAGALVRLVDARDDSRQRARSDHRPRRDQRRDARSHGARAARRSWRATRRARAICRRCRATRRSATR